MESTVLRVRPGSNAEGSADGDLALVKVRMSPEGPTVEEVRGVGSTVVGAESGMSAQGTAGSHRVGAVPRIAAQWPELADGTPVTPAVRYGGLTPFDSRTLR